MKRPKSGSTIKQMAYAKKLFNGQGKSKKEIALSVGYSPAMANNTEAKIEKSEGFYNALQGLALESNNLVLAVMAEYKARGFTKFSNKDLNGALNAISQAWDRIGKQRAPNGNTDPEKNPLRAVFMQRVEKQIINNGPGPVEATVEKEETTASPETEEDIDLDF